MMRSSIVLCLCLAVSSTVRGWGALFNRVNPMSVPAREKTGAYYNYYTESKQDVEEPRVLTQTLENYMKADRNLASLSADPCYERKCESSDQCCDGSVCVDVEGSGTCLPLYGNQPGEACRTNQDCETGYICSESPSGYLQCQEPPPGQGKYGEECRDSSDCNIHLGFCCRLQRRQKMQPKKLCGYFTETDVCIGPVATSKVRRRVHYSANEKRQSPHPDEAEYWRVRRLFPF